MCLRRRDRSRKGGNYSFRRVVFSSGQGLRGSDLRRFAGRRRPLLSTFARNRGRL